MSSLFSDSSIRSSSALALLAGALLLAFFVKTAISSGSSERRRFPPGPKPRFLIGNLLDIPLKDVSNIYLKWSKQLNSSLIHLYALGQRIIVINEREDAEELFEKRSLKYSDRPVVHTLEMIGWEYNFGTFSYGEYWRKHRQICQQNFKAGASQQFHSIQKRKIHDLLLRLLDSPDQFEGHSKLFSISVALATTYGYDAKSLEDPVIKAADRGFELGVKVFSPGGSFVNIFPLLKYVPWTWTRRTSKEAWNLMQKVKGIPLACLMDDLKNGTAAPSLVGDFMQRNTATDPSDHDTQIVLNVANTIYFAASDTVTSVIQSFIYIMALMPNVQAKAQSEIDRIIGIRLPTFEDRASLPYTDAIYREILRRYPPAPMSLPHATSEDDWYKGYFIPKGTIILGNVWAMNHDESRYPDPLSFRPERFLNEHGSVIDEKTLSYGFGRRVCPGKHVASEMTWLTMASILACFHVRRKKDANGVEIEIKDDMEDIGVMRHKSSFQCDILPRSGAHRNLIQATQNKVYHM